MPGYVFTFPHDTNITLHKAISTREGINFLVFRLFAGESGSHIKVRCTRTKRFFLLAILMGSYSGVVYADEETERMIGGDHPVMYLAAVVYPCLAQIEQRFNVRDFKLYEDTEHLTSLSTSSLELVRKPITYN